MSKKLKAELDSAHKEIERLKKAHSLVIEENGRIIASLEEKTKEIAALEKESRLISRYGYV